MEFKEPYLLAMRERAPRLFMELRRSGQLDQHLQQKSEEAHAMLKGILSRHQHPSLPQKREAEEIVRAALIEFPPEEPISKRSRKRPQAKDENESVLGWPLDSRGRPYDPLGRPEE
jgi:hypothetical protein